MTLSLLLALGTGPALADEGLWLPEQVPAMADRLRAMGLGLDAERLADPNGDPLGAVASMGGCSAAFVSPDGLVLTGAHCIQDYLEYSSDAEHDYAKDGVVATHRLEELPAGPSARLWVTERIESVTDEMRTRLGKKLDDRGRSDAIDRASSAIVAACERKTGRSCEVVPLHEGLEWRLVTRVELRDLRVVYAPPKTIALFGGDEDNWAWPRHCGDFALVRAWAAPDGNPAAYSVDNIPYSPAHSLRVEPAGARPGEFVMMAGYPSGTLRWRTAIEAQIAEDVRYPAGNELLTRMIRAGNASARKSRESAIKLEPSLFRFSNTRKNFQGMIDNFARSDIAGRKARFSHDFDAWLAADARRAPFAAATAELRTLVKEDLATWVRDRVVSGIINTPKVLVTAQSAYRLAFERQFPDVDRDPGFQTRDLPYLRDRFEQFDRSFDLPSDRALFAELLAASQELAPDQRIPPIDAWLKAAGGIEPALEELYGSRALLVSAARLRLLDTTRADFERSGDPWIRLAVAIETWQRAVRTEKEVREGALLRTRPAYLEALTQYRGGDIYPEANGTLRLSFGRVEGYVPEDGAVNLPQTTLAGFKKKVREAPFDAPARFLEEVPAAPRTRWADPTLGDVPVNFLSTLDNASGSSGSPTLNSQGAVVGIAFDRNWEAVASDWMYDPELTRSIHVDIRYLLWSLDQVENARVLLAELGVERGG
jgi:hypothetical protein